MCSVKNYVAVLCVHHQNIQNINEFWSSKMYTESILMIKKKNYLNIVIGANWANPHERQRTTKLNNQICTGSSFNNNKITKKKKNKKNILNISLHASTQKAAT